jgi:hypothetical protein
VLFVWASRAEDGDGNLTPDAESALPPGLRPVDPPEMPETAGE